MLATELHTADIPALFSRFVEVVGDRHWLQRVRLCNDEIRGNRFLAPYLHSEYEIAYQLSRLSEFARKYQTIPYAICDDQTFYPAASFVAQVLSAIDRLGCDDGERFRRRVHGALKNPDDMRGLRLELSMATHFLRRGKRVRWPEITGEGTFDLLIDDIGPNGLEVECKSISNDKGRKVHRREMLSFFGLLNPHLKSTISGLASGLLGVLTVPERLPAAYRERQALAKQFGQAIFLGQDRRLPDGISIRVEEFAVDEAELLAHDPTRAVMRTVADRVTRTRNKEVAIMGTKAGGALAIAVQSARDDALLETTFDTLSKAARTQLTGGKAGILLAGFYGLDSDQLLSIAEQDQYANNTPTGLRLHVSRFLSSTRRDHVVGVGFVSAGGFRPAQHGVVDSGGTAYHFPKAESPLWSEDFRGLFDWAKPAT